MASKLKHIFVPGPENNHYPYLFQAAGAAVAITALLFLYGISQWHGSYLASHTNENLGAVIASVLIDQTNSERQGENLNELSLSPKLIAAAQLKANDMAEKSYFAHTSPEGINPWYWFRKVGYRFSFAGENLAVNFRDSSAVTRAWMESPGHRANILNQEFSEIGIATAEGRYKGRDSIYVVQLFGSPYDQPDSGLGEEGDSSTEPVLDPTEQMAAIAQAGIVDSLFVRPALLYSILFITFSLIVIAALLYSIRHKGSKDHRRTILIYGSAILLAIACIAFATLSSLQSGLQIATQVSF
jgi:hypothetical protein